MLSGRFGGHERHRREFGWFVDRRWLSERCATSSGLGDAFRLQAEHHDGTVRRPVAG